MFNLNLALVKNRLQPWNRGKIYRYYYPYEWSIKEFTVFVENTAIGMVTRTYLNPQLNKPYLAFIKTCNNGNAIFGQFESRKAAITSLVETYADRLPLDNGKICDCAKWFGSEKYSGNSWPDMKNYLNKTRPSVSK